VSYLFWVANAFFKRAILLAWVLEPMSVYVKSRCFIEMYAWIELALLDFSYMYIMF